MDGPPWRLLVVGGGGEREGQLGERARRLGMEGQGALAGLAPRPPAALSGHGRGRAHLARRGHSGRAARGARGGDSGRGPCGGRRARGARAAGAGTHQGRRRAALLGRATCARTWRRSTGRSWRGRGWRTLDPPPGSGMFGAGFQIEQFCFSSHRSCPITSYPLTGARSST